MDTNIIELVQLLFPDEWVRLILYFFLAGLILRYVPSFLHDTFKFIKESILPLFSLNEERTLILRERRNFAKRIELELSILNSQETWEDENYAELEAEVEAEDRWYRTNSWLPFIGRVQKGVHREKSLSIALEKTREKLILLEGDPGSGKSVVLRHLAQKLASKVNKSRNIHDKIPIYLNLKELKHNPSEKITANTIRDFVFWSLNRDNDRNLAIFLERHFDRGIKEGTWLFLFDSFDEIPSILSSTEEDNLIQEYTLALSRFLHDMGGCKGIIASRYFRGPQHINWPKFRIQPLNEKRRIDLIKKSGLPRKNREYLINDLESAPDTIREMAKNPMFLSLLCENIKNGKKFPEHVHIVYEDFIDNRLERDEERVEKRFGVSKEFIRKKCEDIAFCMTLDEGLGLSPIRSDLIKSMQKLGFNPPENMELILDAIEFIRLGKSTTGVSGQTKLFSFAHRRFQEYFATCKVISESQHLIPKALLTDGRWRETAVTLLQIQQEKKLEPLLLEAEELLDESLEKIVTADSGYIYDAHPRHIFIWPKINMNSRAIHELPVPFKWPDGLLHLLGILRNGLSSRSNAITPNIREHCSRILNRSYDTGLIMDKRQALEFSGLLPQDDMEKMLIDGIALNNNWVEDVIYDQATKLTELPKKLKARINNSLIALVFSGRYWDEKYSTLAYIQRLPNSDSFTRILKMLIWLPPIDFLINCLILIPLILLHFYYQNTDPDYPAIFGIFLILYSLIGLVMSDFFLLPRYFPTTRELTYKIKSIFFDPVYYLRAFGFSIFIIGIIYGAVSTLLKGSSLKVTNVLLITAMMLAANAWPFSYLVLAKNFISLHPILWIFSPIISIGYIPYRVLQNIIFILKSLANWLRNFQIRLGTEHLYVMAATIGVFLLFGGYAIVDYAVYVQYSEDLYRMFQNVAMLILVVLVLVLLGLAALFVQIRKNNFFKRVRNFQEISLDKFLELLALSSDKRLSGELILHIRENNMLLMTPEVEQTLQKLTSMIQFSNEMYKDDLIIRYFPKPSQESNSFDLWLDNYQKKNNSGVLKISWTAMIEMNRILEQYQKSKIHERNIRPI